jgi:REP element-mobilizing transposase RayT
VGPAALITPELQRGIFAEIQHKCRELKVHLEAIGGVEDHVHLLVRIPTTLTVADLVKHVKGASSHLVTHRLDPDAGFKWQGAYGSVLRLEEGRADDSCLHPQPGGTSP